MRFYITLLKLLRNDFLSFVILIWRPLAKDLITDEQFAVIASGAGLIRSFASGRQMRMTGFSIY